MGEHVVVNVDSAPEADERVPLTKVSGPSGETSAPSHVPVLPGSFPSPGVSKELRVDIPEEGEPLIRTVECRICQEEDNIKNMDNPCACNGSLKYAHKECVQRWVNEKGDLTCEICHESYKPGYVAPPRAQPDDTAIDITGGWAMSGTPLDTHDPRLLAMAAAQRHFLESEYDEYATTNASGAALCRSVALILLALLLLRHALAITNGDDNDDASTFFSHFLLRAAGFLLPCYIMVWAINILQQRRQRQEAAAALAATEVAFILQSGRARGLQFTIAPESPATPVTTQNETPPRDQREAQGE